MTSALEQCRALSAKIMNMPVSLEKLPGGLTEAQTVMYLSGHRDARHAAAELAAAALAAADAALAAQPEPVARMTEAPDGTPMLWPTHAEACQYCDDGEHPMPLYAAPKEPAA